MNKHFYRLKVFLAAFSMIFVAFTARANIVSEPVTYQVDGVELQGFLSYDAEKSKQGKLPAVLIVHEWWGHNAYAQERAVRLAKEGFAAFALDMYGKGKLADHPKDAGAFAGEVMGNIALAEKRFDAAERLLREHKITKNKAVGVLGYCFGGSVALHMARVGKDLAAVVSYHGGLAQVAEYKDTPIKAKIQVYTGQADPMIPAKQVAEFTEQMFGAGADFSVQVYPGVKHSFTNAGATEKGEKFGLPLAYDAHADADSWSKTLKLLREQL